MRQSLLQQKKELLHYKKLYSAECRHASLRHKEISKLKETILNLEAEVKELRSINASRPTNTCKRKARQLKEWENKYRNLN